MASGFRKQHCRYFDGLSGGGGGGAVMSAGAAMLNCLLFDSERRIRAKYNGRLRQVYCWLVLTYISTGFICSFAIEFLEIVITNQGLSNTIEMWVLGVIDGAMWGLACFLGTTIMFCCGNISCNSDCCKAGCKRCRMKCCACVWPLLLDFIMGCVLGAFLGF